MAAKPPSVIEYDTKNVDSNGESIVHRYSIMHPIGTTKSITPIGAIAPSCSATNVASTSTSKVASTPTVTLPVYQAAVGLPHSEDYEDLNPGVFVSIVCVNMNDAPALNIPAAPNHLGEWFASAEHRNLVGAMYPPFTHDGFYCVVFPHMELGSVKSVMAKYFPEGIPEEGVLVVLKEVLTRLRTIHQEHFCHHEICSAHIYVSAKPEIKMGFSTSAFDLDEDFQEFDLSSATHIWAAAPEVYGSAGGPYTEKCDVWSVGFTALEMVYGGFEAVINRKHLENVLKKMRKKKKISGKSIVLQNVTGSPPAKPWKNKVGEKVSEFLNPMKTKKKYKKKVSKKFRKVVLRCLAENAEERPTVEELLQMRIFQVMQWNAANFRDLVMKAKSSTRSSRN